jgi:hypothetical protein
VRVVHRLATGVRPHGQCNWGCLPTWIGRGRPGGVLAGLGRQWGLAFWIILAQSHLQPGYWRYASAPDNAMTFMCAFALARYRLCASSDVGSVTSATADKSADKKSARPRVFHCSHHGGQLVAFLHEASQPSETAHIGVAPKVATKVPPKSPRTAAP